METAIPVATAERSSHDDRPSRRLHWLRMRDASFAGKRRAGLGGRIRKGRKLCLRWGSGCAPSARSVVTPRPPQGGFWRPLNITPRDYAQWAHELVHPPRCAPTVRAIAPHNLRYVKWPRRPCGPERCGAQAHHVVLPRPGRSASGGCSGFAASAAPFGGPAPAQKRLK